MNKKKRMPLGNRGLKKRDLERIIEYRAKGAILTAKYNRWHNEDKKIQNILKS